MATINTSTILNTLIKNISGSSRFSELSRSGMLSSGERDMAHILRYPKTITFSQYYDRYENQGLARTAIELLPDSAWDGEHEIVSDDNEGLSEEIKEFDDRVGMFSTLHEADINSRIGTFGIVFIGVADGKELKEAVETLESLDDIAYLSSFHEGDVEIGPLDDDQTSKRFGLPLFYRIDFGGMRTEVHWSRVIHVSHTKSKMALYGTPKLKTIYRYLIDMDKVSGGSSEMFYQNGRNGIHYKIDTKEGKPSDEEAEAIVEEILDFEEGLERSLILGGIEVKPIVTPIPNPKENKEMLLEEICSTLRIPKRIFMGSERGEQASSQDRDNFSDTVSQYRKTLKRILVVPFIERLMEFGCIATSKFVVDWSPLGEPTERERLENAKLVMEILSIYHNGGVENLMSREKVFEDYVGDEYENEQEEMIRDERESIAQDTTEEDERAQES